VTFQVRIACHCSSCVILSIQYEKLYSTYDIKIPVITILITPEMILSCIWKKVVFNITEIVLCPCYSKWKQIVTHRSSKCLHLLVTCGRCTLSIACICWWLTNNGRRNVTCPCQNECKYYALNGTAMWLCTDNRFMSWPFGRLSTTDMGW